MVLDKRTLKREGIKRRKICQINMFKNSGEKERKKFSLSIDWMMISPKVAKHLLPSPVLWRARSSHFKEGRLAQEEIRGYCGFELC